MCVYMEVFQKINFRLRKEVTLSFRDWACPLLRKWDQPFFGITSNGAEYLTGICFIVAVQFSLETNGSQTSL